MRKAVQEIGSFAAEEIDAAVARESGTGRGTTSFVGAMLLALIVFELSRVLLNARSLTSTIAAAAASLGDFAPLTIWGWLALQAFIAWFAVNALKRSPWSISAGRVLRELIARSTPPRFRTQEQQAIADAASLAPRPYATIGVALLAAVGCLLFANALTKAAPIELPDMPALTPIATALLGLGMSIAVAFTLVSIGQDRMVALGWVTGVFGAFLALLLTAPTGDATAANGTVAAAVRSEPSLLEGASLRNYRVLGWLIVALSFIRMATLVLGRSSAPKVARINSVASGDPCIRFSRQHQRAIVAPVLVELKPDAFPQSVVVVYRENAAQIISGRSLVPVTEAECDVLRLDRLRSLAESAFGVASAQGLYAAQASVTVTPWSSESEVRSLRVSSEAARRFVEQLFINSPRSTIERAIQAALDRYVMSMRRAEGGMTSAEMLSRIEREHREATRTLADLTGQSAALQLHASGALDEVELLNRRIEAERGRLIAIRELGAKFEDALAPIQKSWLQVREGQERAIGTNLAFEKDLRMYLATGGSFDDSPSSREAADHIGTLLGLCGITVRITDLQLGAGAAQAADDALRTRLDEMTRDIRNRIDEANKSFGELVTMAINMRLKGQGMDHDARIKLIESMGPSIVALAMQPGGLEKALPGVFRTEGAASVKQIAAVSRGAQGAMPSESPRQPIDPDGDPS